MGLKNQIIKFLGGITAEELKKEQEKERKAAEIAKSAAEAAHRQEVEKRDRERQSELDFRKSTEKALSDIRQQTLKIDVVFTAQADKDAQIKVLKEEIEHLREGQNSDFGTLLKERIKDVEVEKQERKAVNLQLDVDLIAKYQELHDAGYIKGTRSTLINRLLRQYISGLYQSLAMIKKEE